jgi:hypothetical protein
MTENIEQSDIRVIIDDELTLTRTNSIKSREDDFFYRTSFE